MKLDKDLKNKGKTSQPQGNRSRFLSIVRRFGVPLFFPVLFVTLAAGGILNPGAAQAQRGQSAKVTSKPVSTPRPTTSSKSAPGRKSTSGLGPTLAATRFDLVGVDVTVDPSTQTVPINTPTEIRTLIAAPTGVDPEAYLATINPNYRIRGELSGPAYANPIQMEVRIGESFPIPGFGLKGDYVLQNLRVVDAGVQGAPTVAAVTPDACVISVIDQILVTNVQVRELTYDEIVRSGIQVTDSSYQFFNFTLALGTESNGVSVQIPVAFPPNSPGIPPTPIVGNVSLPNDQIALPDVQPVMLDIQTDGEGDDPNYWLKDDADLGGDSGGNIKVPGLVVFPGRVGFLNQFFEAVVIVANGSPAGSNLVVRTLTAKVKLPEDGSLRVPAVQGLGIVTEKSVKGLGADNQPGTPDDEDFLAAGKSGQAKFLIEGLTEGLHTVDFDLQGTLTGLTTGRTAQIAGTARGAVLVRDRTFATTFTHPGVVRTGQEYDLAMTVLNTGQANINGAFASLPPNSLSGATLLPGDTGRRDFPTTILPGQSGTIKWRLRAGVTGQVTASYVKVGNSLPAGLTLVTGVGDRNIPLSPDSLVLPDNACYLPPDVLDAARATLGQAWSVATTPAYALPDGVTPISKATVIRRAVDVGIAGLRVQFGESIDVSLATLTRDWVGVDDATVSVGFAEVLQKTISGFAWSDALGGYYRRRLLGLTTLPTTPTCGNSGSLGTAVGLADLHRNLIEAESPRDGFLTAFVIQPDGMTQVRSGWTDPSGKTTGFGPGTVRTGDIPQTGVSDLREVDFTRATETLPTSGVMLWATNPANGNWSLDLYGVASGTAEVSVAVPIQGGRKYNRYRASVPASAGSRHRIVIRPFTNDIPRLEIFQNGSFSTVGPLAFSEMVSEPSPSVTEVRQVTSQVLEGGDDFGRFIGVLFNKPMSESSLTLTTAAAAQSRFRIEGGEILSNPSERVVSPVKATGSIPNYGKRFVFIRLDSPVGPFVKRTLSITGATDAGFQNLSLPEPFPILMTVSPQGQPAGGYATGRVLNGDGSPVVGTVVSYFREREGCFGNYIPELLGKAVTDSDGRFSFDYVRNNVCSNGPVFSTIHPTTGSIKGISNFVAFHGQNLTPDLVFLARGRVQGTIVNQNGSPSPRAFVQVTPTLDPKASTIVQADEAGAFQVNDLPVGSLAVKAQAVVGNAPRPFGYAAGFIDGPNATATVRLVLRENSGTVRGEVREANGALSKGRLVVASRPGLYGPVGEIVGFTYTDNQGQFSIPGLPLEQLYVSTPDPSVNLIGSPVDWRSFTVTPLNPVASGLVLTLPGYGDVAGFLRDDAGNGIPGIVICEGRGVRTNADGSFLIRAVPQGAQDIEGTENATGFKAGSRIQVTAGQTTSNVVLTIRRPLAPGVIEGYVRKMVNGTEVPVSGVLVTYDGLHPYTLDLELPPIERQPIPIRTDGSGYYRLEGVPSGTGFTVRYVGNQAGHYANVDVEVAPNQTVTRNVVFNPATIRLRIRQDDGTPVVGTIRYSVPGLVSNVYRKRSFGIIDPDPGSQGQNGFSESLTNPDGTLEFKIIPGLYRLGAYNTFGLAPGITGTLAPGETLEHDFYLVSNLNPAGSLRGTVFQPDGVTPVGAGVRVLIGLQDVRTDAEGKYLFPIIADRSGTLTATDPQTGLTNQIRIVTNPTGEVVQDIRLLGYGDVRVRVVDGAGQPVQNAIVNVNGGQYPNAKRRVQLFPVDAGQTVLSNLFEGDYSIEATADLVSGRAAVTVLRGQITEVTIRVAETGTVVGKVWLPGRTAGSGLADTSLYSGGRLIGFMTSSSNADSYGDFRFVGVPKGPFEVRVFDNRTGRVGTAFGTIIEQNVEVRADVDLNSVGKVTGQVRSNGLPYSGITVEIQSPNATNFKPVRATTDAEGRFSFPGVPSGRFQVRTLDGPAGFNGITTGDVPSGAEPLPDTVADINLRPTAKLQGTIFAADGVTPVVGARVTVNVDGFRFNVASDEQGRYLTEWAPLGQGVVYAESPLGYDRGFSEAFTLSTPGATETRNVTLRGVATISGVAYNNDGQRLNQGTVSYTSTSEGNQIRLTATVQPDGTFSFAGVPAGGYSLTLAVTGRTGVGAFSGTLSSGETATVNLTLSDAGTVVGRTLGGSSGDIGIPNTKVTLRMTTGPLFGTTFVTYTNASGRFAFAAVPLGNFVLRAENFALQAAADGGGILAANEQIVDVGDISLDGTPISVASVNPANGSLASRDSDVVVTFSEPANSATVNGTIRVLDGTTPVPGTVTLSTDKLTATFHPATRFANANTFTVRVTTDLADLVGNRMIRNFESTFTTVDDVPPVLLAIDPVDRAVQVPLAYQFKATFDEHLLPNQDPNAFRVTTLTGQAVNGTLTVTTLPDGKGRLVLDVTELVASTNYLLTVQGVRDVSGNVQATPSVTRFSSSDFTRPVINSIAVNGNEIVDNPTVTIPPTPIFTADLTDDASGINPDSLTATLDGTPVTGFTVTAQGPEPNPAYRFGWNPTTLPDGQHTLVLTVKDRANNLSLIRSATFTIQSDPVPQVSIVKPGPTDEIVAGERLVLSANVTDNQSVATVRFLVNGVQFATFTNGPFEKVFLVPTNATQLQLEVEGTDNLGQTTRVQRSWAVVPDPKTTVVGTVLSVQGDPVPNAQVTINKFGLTTLTDATGHFTFENVSTIDGTFYVSVMVGQGIERKFGMSGRMSPVRHGSANTGAMVVSEPIIEFDEGEQILGNSVFQPTVALPFEFTLFGQPRTQLWVSPGGFISFDGEDYNSFYWSKPRAAVQFGFPARDVFANVSRPDRVVITWRDDTVPQSFQCVIFADGRVQYGYRLGNASNNGGFSVGLSPGPQAEVQTVDWSNTSEGVLGSNIRLVENFAESGPTAKPFDLQNSVITFRPDFNHGYTFYTQSAVADSLPPTVIETIPASNQLNVAANSTVRVRFSEPLDPATNPAAIFQLDQYKYNNIDSRYYEKVEGTGVLNQNRTELTFTPNQPLQGPGEEFRIHVVGLRDVGGNTNPSDFYSGFQTFNQPPVVTIVSPQSGQTLVEGQWFTILARAIDSDTQIGQGSITVNDGSVPVNVISVSNGEVLVSCRVPVGVSSLNIRARFTNFWVPENGDSQYGLPGEATLVIPVSSDQKTTVTGRMVDANGQPVPNATVKVRDLNTLSGSDGTFTISNVPSVSGGFLVSGELVSGQSPLYGNKGPFQPNPGGTISVGDVVLNPTPIFVTEIGNSVPISGSLFRKAASVPLPFPFTYYGVTYSEVTVGTDGSLYFGTPNPNGTFNDANPRIAGSFVPSASWSNQPPNYGIFYNGNIVGRAVFTWKYGENYGFQVILDQDGTIRSLYLNPPYSQFTVGVTPGNATVDTIDFTAQSPFAIPADRGAREDFEDYLGSSHPFDLRGRALTFVPQPGGGYSVTCGQTSRDLQSPTLVSSFPTNGQTGFPVNGQIRLTFDEAIDPAQDFFTRVQVTKVNGGGVYGSFSLDETLRILTFIPTVQLADSANYQIRASGISDLAGNTYFIYTTIDFSTADQTPPAIDPILYDLYPFYYDGGKVMDGLVTGQLQAYFLARWTDFSSVPSDNIHVFLDGTEVTAQAEVFFNFVRFYPTAPLSSGQHTFRIETTDTAGNSSTRSATMTVDTSPRIQNVTPATGPETGGTQITITGVNLQGATVFIGGNQAVVPEIPSSDSIIAFTPPGQPGSVTVEVRTPQGNAELLNGFTYSAEPNRKTPYQVEPDTALLWRLDGPLVSFDQFGYQVYGSGAYDESPNGIHIGTYPVYPTTTLDQGKFFLGQNGLRAAAEDRGVLSFGNGDFTAELWVKTNPAQPRNQTFTLIGKEDEQAQNSEFALAVTPDGKLKGILYDTNATAWEVATDQNLVSVDDGNWHLVSWVVNRTAGTSTLFIDGQSKAASQTPPNFGGIVATQNRLQVGAPDADGPFREQYGYDPYERFNGTVDEVRISNSAHSASDILGIWNGTLARPTNADGKFLQRGETATLAVQGYNLETATFQIIDETGMPWTGTTVAPVMTTPDRVVLNVTIDADAPVGRARLGVTMAGQLTALPVDIVNQTAALPSPETVLLWPLDSFSQNQDGLTETTDLSSNAFTGTVDQNPSPISISSAGRFGNSIHGIANGPDGSASVGLGTNGFTAGAWMRLNRAVNNGTFVPQPRSYSISLVTRGSYDLNRDFTLDLLVDNSLRGRIYDPLGVIWEVRSNPIRQFTNLNWHQVSMVVDLQANEARLYLDGALVATGAKPVAFTTINQSGAAISANIPNGDDGYIGFFGFAPTQFLDEVRVLNVPMTPQQIRDEWFGVPGAVTSSRTISPFQKLKTENWAKYSPLQRKQRESGELRIENGDFLKSRPQALTTPERSKTKSSNR